MNGEIAVKENNIATNDNFRAKVENLSSRIGWPQKGDRTLASIALLATLVAAIIVLILWTSAKNYVPLYGNQESYDKANILEILDKEQFSFRIDTDTGNIMVPQDKLADARITLAARGIKAAMPEGLNNIGDKVNMGTSQFMESKQYQHALEGELARTIIDMDGVRNTRVHLAIPKRSLFIGREEQKTSASVMVELTPGTEFKTQQVEAIVSLVVGSVPGLDPRNVSVVDQRGKLLSGELYDETPVGKDTNKKLAFIERLERNIEQRASIMLLPILGEGNYRIQVSSDVDFSVVEETRESLDPNTIVMSERTKTDSSLDQLAVGIPGSLANQPPVGPDGQDDENANERTSERSEVQRQYESGHSVTHTRYEVGRLKSMSVSVLVNDAVASTPDGWSEQRLAVLGEMVRTATGFQAERGDQFNIASFQFVVPDATITQDGMELAWWQMPIVQEYARYLFSTVIALLLIFFGVRPLVTHLINGKRPHSPAEESGNVENSASQGMVRELLKTEHVSAEENKGTLLSGSDTPEEGHNKSSDMALPSAGSQFEEQIAHMQYLAERESGRVTTVIKQWVQQGVQFESSKP